MSKRNIAILVVAVLIIGGGLWYATSHKKTYREPINKTLEAKASITKVTMGTALAQDGSIVQPKTVFTPTTKNIYAVLALANTSSQSQLSYIRYYEGKYVDSMVSHPSKDDVKNFHFQWTLNPGKTLKAGHYSLVFYINGKKSQTIDYQIK